ncbi:hypothetical protein DX910_01480 [Acinetobacter haemolyticus]|nr:hypothetical protein DX910_01480 [Acinetobacter haemolyticus]
MSEKNTQNNDLFGTGYNEKLKLLTSKYAPKVPLVNTLYGRFLNFIDIFESWDVTESQADFNSKVTRMIAELDKHLAGGPYNEYYAQLINHSFSKGFHNNITLKFGFIVNEDECLWDLFSMQVDDPVMCFCLLGLWYPKVKRVSYVIDSQKPIISFNKPKLYRFHPERFGVTRRYVKPVVDMYKNEVNLKNGFLSLPQVNFVASEIVNSINTTSFRFPLKKRLHTNQSLLVESERVLATAYCRYIATGKQIFQLSKQLTEMLKQTNNDDIQIDTLKIPYNSIYLYFGPQDDLVLENGWLVDGAYIESRGERGSFKFTLTCVPLDIENSKLWFLEKEPCYSQDIVETYQGEQLKDVIARVYTDTINAISSTKPIQAIEEVSSETGIKIIDISEDNAIERLYAEEKKFPVYESALRLIINALCYVTNYKEDIEYKFTDDVPEILINNTLTSKQSKKLEEKLINDGYRKVYICGEKLSNQINSSATQRSSIEVHWRRGHWRKQPYGEKRELTKLIWIMPMLIGAGESGVKEATRGHIYEAK